MLSPLVSTRGLYLWILNCVSITMELSCTLLNPMVNPPAPVAHQKGTWSCRPLSLVSLGQSLPWIAYPCCFGTITFPTCTWLCQTSKKTVVVLASFPMAPHSVCLQLSRRLVLTGWGAHPNCNLILNCAGSSRHFLRQKLQDGKRISSSELAKRPMCNIRWNRWCITRGTQPGKRLLCLEARSYNKSHPSPKAYCFSEIDDQKPFLIVWILAWLS
jgi:hypothetical protein